MCKRSFRPRHPSKVKVEDVTRNFGANLLWKTETWRCEHRAFVRDIPPKVRVEDVKTKLSCETSLKKWQLKMWKRNFCASLFFLWDLFCYEISLLWDFAAMRSLCHEIFLLWDFCAVRSRCCEISLLWDLFVVRLTCGETSLLRGFNDLQRSVTLEVDFQFP